MRANAPTGSRIPEARNDLAQIFGRVHFTGAAFITQERGLSCLVGSGIDGRLGLAD